MALSLIIDDKSLILLLIIIVLLTISIFIGKSYQPLVHPLILSRQSDVSPVRRNGQSAVYRNANSPVGFDLASQPRRAVGSVRTILEKGTGNEEDFQFDRKRTLYGKDFSNKDILTQSQRFGKGLANLTKLKDETSSLALGVCVEVDSVYSLMATLSGDLQENATKNRYCPIVIAPVHIKKDNIPSDLPDTLQKKGNSSLHAVFTTSVALNKAAKLKIVGKDTILIVGTEKEKDEVSNIAQNKIYTFDQVLEHASEDQREEPENVKNEKAIHSIFWSSEGWVETSNASLIAGLTVNLSFYSSDSQPTKKDHIFVEQSPFIESPSIRLAAASTPAGLSLALLALYTGASLTASTIASSQNDPNASPSNEFIQTSPTLVYSSASGASDLAACLCTVSKRSPLAKIANHAKMAALRHGTFNKNGIWDSILFNWTRKNVGCDHLRSVIILSEGPNVGQDLLDTLRVQLGCTVRLAYLPSGPLELYDNSVNSGVNGRGRQSFKRSVLVTAPISITHSLDLQAFKANAFQGKQVPAQVGPPNCALELKLVETEYAVGKGMKITGVNSDIDPGREQDPFGEIFIRGHSLTNVEGFSADRWCSTGDLGTIRSNGTLVVLSDKANSVEVDVPTLSAEYPSTRRSSRIGAGGHPTRILPMLSILTLLVCCTLTDVTQAQSVYHLNRRGSPSSVPNETFVNGAISSFLSTPRASWEQGVAQSAMLEYLAGSWSVFSGSQKPNYLRGTQDISTLPNFIQMMATSSMKSQSSDGQLCTFVTGNEVNDEGSALDPASCGEAVLLTAFANGQISTNGQIDQTSSFGQAASRQLNYLLTGAPRMSNGAISMRNDGEAYWSDGVYMGPPFIALYGLMTQNQTLLQAAYDQVRLYRDALRITSGSAENLFKHIVNATGTLGNDNGAWLTGNAWSAAGMCRVLASIAQSNFSDSMSSQMNDLVGWIDEIVTAALSAGNPLIHNYVNDSTTFEDAGGSSLIAYSAFRLATISPNSSLSMQIQQSENIYSLLQSKLGPTSQLLEGYTVPNPLTFTQPSQGSPESMAFMVLMSSARRDYLERNVTGLNGPSANSALAYSTTNFVTLLVISLTSTLISALL